MEDILSNLTQVAFGSRAGQYSWIQEPCGAFVSAAEDGSLGSARVIRIRPFDPAIHQYSRTFGEWCFNGLDRALEAERRFASALSYLVTLERHYADTEILQSREVDGGFPALLEHLRGWVSELLRGGFSYVTRVKPAKTLQLYPCAESKELEARRIRERPGASLPADARGDAPAPVLLLRERAELGRANAERKRKRCDGTQVLVTRDYAVVDANLGHYDEVDFVRQEPNGRLSAFRLTRHPHYSWLDAHPVPRLDDGIISKSKLFGDLDIAMPVPINPDKHKDAERNRKLVLQTMLDRNFCMLYKHDEMGEKQRPKLKRLKEAHATTTFVENGVCRREEEASE
jgi:hypothetical protein